MLTQVDSTTAGGWGCVIESDSSRQQRPPVAVIVAEDTSQQSSKRCSSFAHTLKAKTLQEAELVVVIHALDIGDLS